MAVLMDHQFSGTIGAAFAGDANFTNLAGTVPTYVDAGDQQIGLRFPAGVQSLIQKTITSTTNQILLDAVFEFSAVPTIASEIVQFRAAAKSSALIVSATGKFQMQNASSAGGTSVSNVVVNTKYRIVVNRNGTTTTATIYNNDDDSTVWQALVATQAADALTSIRIGWSSSTGAGAGVTMTVSWPRIVTTEAEAQVRTYAPVYFGAATFTGWTAVGAAGITALSDNSDSTYLSSPGNPSGSFVDLTLSPLVPPTGDLVVNLRGVFNNATTSSMTVTLREGTTTIATASLPTAFDGTLKTVKATFAAANLTGISAATWNAGTLVVRVSVSAS